MASWFPRARPRSLAPGEVYALLSSCETEGPLCPGDRDADHLALMLTGTLYISVDLSVIDTNAQSVAAALVLSLIAALLLEHRVRLRPVP